MEDVNQRDRADAYHRNLVAIIFATRCEYQAYVERHGDGTLGAAAIRNRLRSLVATVDSIEAGEYHCTCEACGGPLIDGHQVITYDDAGQIHADCQYPRFASDDPPSHEYDSGLRPEQCARELERAKAVLTAADGVE